MTLRNDGLLAHVLEWLLAPPQEVADASNPDFQQSLDLYLATKHASEKTYRKSCETVLQRNPEYELLSFHRVQQTIKDLMGVMPVTHDMCIDSCTAFTLTLMHVHTVARPDSTVKVDQQKILHHSHQPSDTGSLEKS